MDCIVGHGQLRARLKYRRRGGRRNVTGNETKETCVAKEQTTERSLAKPGRLLQHGLEHRIEVAGRTRYDAQHLRRGRLLLQRFGKFARSLLLRLEEPCVFDRNDRLISEGLDQFNLLFGEWPYRIARQDDYADWSSFAHKWNGKHGTISTKCPLLDQSVLRIGLDI